MARRGGILGFKLNGVIEDAKGNFTFGFGGEKKEAIVGADAIHDYKTTQLVPFIEGAITDRGDLDLEDIWEFSGTITLEHANGKIYVLRDAWYAGDRQGSTEEGEIPVRFEGKSLREIQ